MCAKTNYLKAALPAVVASITMLSVFVSAQDTAAYQGASPFQGKGETCAFSLQMQKPAFKMRYMQKVQVSPLPWKGEAP